MFEIVEAPPVLYSAAGWLGQYLTIDAEAGVVAVRMRKARPEDYGSDGRELKDERDAFRDFPRYVAELTR